MPGGQRRGVATSCHGQVTPTRSEAPLAPHRIQARIGWSARPHRCPMYATTENLSISWTYPSSSGRHASRSRYANGPSVRSDAFWTPVGISTWSRRVAKSYVFAKGLQSARDIALPVPWLSDSSESLTSAVALTNATSPAICDGITLSAPGSTRTAPFLDEHATVGQNLGTSMRPSNAVRSTRVGPSTRSLPDAGRPEKT
jgi:hypothetical protein